MAAVTLVPVAGQIPPLGGAQAYTADLAARRAKTMTAIGSDAVLVMWSAPQRLYSDDVHYEYRQESNLLYLTGIDQPDTILVLVPGAKSQKEHLFVRRGEPLRELWSGHTSDGGGSHGAERHRERARAARDRSLRCVHGGVCLAGSREPGAGKSWRARAASTARATTATRHRNGAREVTWAARGRAEVSVAQGVQRR